MMSKLISYFEGTWLVSNFFPRLWNVCEADSSSPRTSNHLLWKAIKICLNVVSNGNPSGL